MNCLSYLCSSAFIGGPQCFFHSYSRLRLRHRAVGGHYLPSAAIALSWTASWPAVSSFTDLVCDSNGLRKSRSYGAPDSTSSHASSPVVGREPNPSPSRCLSPLPPLRSCLLSGNPSATH